MSAQGQSGPKARPTGVVDGQRVDIPVPVAARPMPFPVMLSRSRAGHLRVAGPVAGDPTREAGKRGGDAGG